MKLKATLLLLCAGLFAASSSAQFVEITADIEVTSWRYQEETGLPLKTIAARSVRCVAGTNTWLIEIHSGSNATESVWFVDGKIVRLSAQSQYAAPEDTGFGTMRRGPRSANVTLAPDGYPGGELILNLPWFAFCSGPYLQRPKRSLPLPTPMPGRPAFGFRDEATVFPDTFGLPRRVQFFAVPQHLKCDYQVQQSTNVLGWNFPTAFTVVQNEPDAFGIWKKQLTVSARVQSIHPAPKPEMPEELRQRVEYWERLPSRRK